MAASSNPTKTGSGTAWRARNTKSGLVRMATVPITALRRLSSRFAMMKSSTAPIPVIAVYGNRTPHSLNTPVQRSGPFVLTASIPAAISQRSSAGLEKNQVDSHQGWR